MARKQKTIHYLYKTTCLVTGRYYIGMHSTYNLDDGYMGSGKRLRYSIRKYGIDNHKKEILEFFESRELLIEAEKKAITEEMITDNNCMNIMSGGTGGFISVEQQRHRSICANQKHNEKLINDLEYRKKWLDKKIKSQILAYDEGRREKKYFYNWNGKQHSEETKSKLKKTKNIGETNSQYGTCWITKDALNKKIKKEDLNSFISDGWIKGRK